MVLDHGVKDHIVVADAAEAVTAEHNDVAVVQLVDACLGFCTFLHVTQTAGDNVRQRMVVHQLRIQLTLVNKFLDIGMVFRQLDEPLLLVEDVAPTVTTPADIRLVIENPSQDGSSTHTTGITVFLASVKNIQVGSLHYSLHKLLDGFVSSDSCLQLFRNEQLLDGLHGNGRSHLAGICSTHTVGNYQQYTILTKLSKFTGLGNHPV